MANHACELSAWMSIPKNKTAKAESILNKIEYALENSPEEGYCGIRTSVDINDDNEAGVWFRHEESANPDHAEAMARALVEELKLNAPFTCSWAYTCSKPRIDNFGGGAFVVIRGMKTKWFDAQHIANAWARRHDKS